jgi:hypothetical protein
VTLDRVASADPIERVDEIAELAPPAELSARAMVQEDESWRITEKGLSDAPSRS